MTLVAGASLIISLISLVLYMIGVGVIGGAISKNGDSDKLTVAVVGFAVIFAIVVYGTLLWFIIWELVVAVNVIKASSYMQDKAEEKADIKNFHTPNMAGKQFGTDAQQLNLNPYMVNE